MSKSRRYGITFPFTIKSDDNTFVDLNKSKLDSVKSQLVHLLFTPKGQRLRKPLFGSSLIQYIFEPNEKQTWSEIESEVKEMVSKNIPDCRVASISVNRGNMDNGIIVNVMFTVSNGPDEKSETLTIKI